jgi:hypothetical protein
MRFSQGCPVAVAHAKKDLGELLGLEYRQQLRSNVRSKLLSPQGSHSLVVREDAALRRQQAMLCRDDANL